MTKYLYVFIFTLISSLLVNEIKAQDILYDSISFDSEIIFQKVSENLLKTPSKVKQKKSSGLLKKFREEWNGGAFNPDEKKGYRAACRYNSSI